MFKPGDIVYCMDRYTNQDGTIAGCTRHSVRPSRVELRSDAMELDLVAGRLLVLAVVTTSYINNVCCLDKNGVFAWLDNEWLAYELNP